MALHQLVATITINPRQQGKVRDALLGFDTDLSREGLIASEPRGFAYQRGRVVWAVIPVGAAAARQVKRRLKERLEPFPCQIAWQSLISGHLHDARTCHCQPPALLLYTGIASEPDVILCGGCFGLVGLPSLPLSLELRQGLTAWADDYRHIQALWLASGEYEEWAAQQTDRPDSPLNVKGRTLAAQVEEVTGLPTYYFLHSYSVSSRDLKTPRLCPNCAQPFTSNEFAGQDNLHVCEPCRIVWPEPVEVV